MSQNYNINMKKFNGTDYDNLLPLAYNALNSQQLDGQTFNEIQNLINARSQISTGSYVGTGTYGENNPTIINCGFKPKMIIVGTVDNAFTNENFSNWYLWKNGTQIGTVRDKNFKVTNSLDTMGGKGLPENPIYIFYDQTALTFPIMRATGVNDYWHYFFLTFSLSNTSIQFWCNEYVVTQSSSAQIGAGFMNASYQHNKSGVTYRWVAVH